FRTQTQRVFDAALGVSSPDEALDAMLFLHEGRTFGQLVAHLERQEIQYPFAQAVGGTPVEGGAIIASRWAGQTVTMVFGTLKGCYVMPGCFVVTNTPQGPREAAIAAALKLLQAQIPGARLVDARGFLDAGVLVLRPDGADAQGRERLTYVYRTRGRLVIDGVDTDIILWAGADAERARVEAFERLDHPFADSVAAAGMAFRRDPGRGAMPARFRVDPAENGKYTLRLKGLIDKLHVPAPDVDVSIDASTLGSSNTLANFAQWPIEDVDRAPCASGPRSRNVAFLQVNLFATIFRDVAAAVAAGMFSPFPSPAFQPMIDTSGRICEAMMGLQFWSCKGYLADGCPDVHLEAPTPERENAVNYADDNTVIGHEIGHVITGALAKHRPPDWCNPGASAPTCPRPTRD